jgi:hypothetical protein
VGVLTTLFCSICRKPIEAHKSVVYLYAGAVVHVACWGASRGALGNCVALVRPSTQAMRRRAREPRADARTAPAAANPA